MPPVIIAVVAAAASYGAAAAAVSAGLVAAGSFGAAMIGAVAAMAVSAIGASILGGPKRPELPSFAQQAQDRTVSVRQPITTHKLLPGFQRVGGSMTFLDTTSSNNKLHLVYTLGGLRPASEMLGIYFNNIYVPLNASGQAQAPGVQPDGTTPTSFVNLARIIFGDGSVAGDATFNTELAAATDKWTPTCKQFGHPKIYVELTWSQQIYGPIGIPNISVMMRGREVYDPRVTGVTIVSSSVAAPGVFTTLTPHGLVAGDHCFIQDHAGSVPAIDQEYEVNTAPTTTTFTLLDQGSDPIQITTGGTGGTVTKMTWTDNAALVCNDFLLDPTYGFSAQYSTEIPETVLIAAANACDEIVGITTLYSGVFTANAGTDLLTLALLASGADPSLPLGMQVRLTTTGTLPAPLAINTVYYVVPESGLEVKLATSLPNAIAGTTIDLTTAGTGIQTMAQCQTVTADATTDRLTAADNRARLLTGTRVQFTTTGTLPAGLSLATNYFVSFITDTIFKVSTSLTNARLGTYVDITDAGTGTHFVTPNGEPRYTCNGTIDTGQDLETIIKALLSSMGGYLVPTGISLGLYAAAYRTPAVTLDEDDLRGPISVQTLQSGQQSFNSVKGTFVDPFSAWQPTDLPQIVNQTYIDDDNGEQIWRDVGLLYTISSATGQRLMNIELERMRRELMVSMQCKLTAFEISVPDVYGVDNTMWGWVGETFEASSWQQVVVSDEAGNPYVGVDLAGRQTDALVYAWDPSQQLPQRAWVNSTLPNAFVVAPPTVLTLASGTLHLYIRQDGTVQPRIFASWTASVDRYVDSGGFYEAQYKLTTDVLWTKCQPIPGNLTSIYIPDVNDDEEYDVRVRAMNSLGVYSDITDPWAATVSNYTVIGKTAPPTDLPTLTIGQSDNNVIAVAGAIPDLDQAITEFRFGPLLTDWADMNLIEQVPSKEGVDTGCTTAKVPPGTWRFGAKSRDTSKNYSANAIYVDAAIEASGVVVVDPTGVDMAPNWPAPSVFDWGVADNDITPDYEADFGLVTDTVTDIVDFGGVA